MTIFRIDFAVANHSDLTECAIRCGRKSVSSGMLIAGTLMLGASPGFSRKPGVGRASSSATMARLTGNHYTLCTLLITTAI